MRQETIKLFRALFIEDRRVLFSPIDKRKQVFLWINVVNVYINKIQYIKTNYKAIDPNEQLGAVNICVIKLS